MDRGRLIELAERCEKAEGPNFALEQEIGALLGIRHIPEKPVAPAFTASLDAAILLVPEGCAWTLDGGDPHCHDSASIGLIPQRGALLNPQWTADGVSPALALCAAALRARASAARL